MPDIPWRSGAGYDHREYTVNGTPLVGEVKKTLYAIPGDSGQY